MTELKLDKVFTLIEPGPVSMVTTSHKGKHNIMTISWHMVMDFTPRFALLTGPWNYSFEALKKTKECVIAIPTINLLDKVISVGTTRGKETDKFAEFKLTPLEAAIVKAPLVKECYANIECKVVEYITRHNIFILDAMKAWTNGSIKEKTIFHYRGDGIFVADGKTYKRRARMKSKLAPGV